MMQTVSLRGGSLEIRDVVGVAREGASVRIAPEAVKKIKAARAVVERHLGDGEAHYGINTGFGSLAKKRIAPGDLETLQRNLIRSHSAGVGEPLPRDVTRAMMLCLAASLSRGHSGVRPEVVELLVSMLNKGVTPVVPSLGSVGASGDLAPLASVALAMIGEGECELDGKRVRTAVAMKQAKLRPLVLKAKEGLALINGTHLMCGWGTLHVADASSLADSAEIALAMSIDACRASHSFLDPRLYAVRNHPELSGVAERVSSLLAGSEIRESHRQDDPRVQDPYSLRAGVTVLGASSTQIGVVGSIVQDELGSVTDNPLVFSGSGGSPAIVSGANFHGMPLAIPLDTLAIAIFHIAGISERRSYLMTGAFEPESHLKPFLTPQPGLSSGLMIAQYTAAACVNEMATLSTPASVVNITTCAGMEDYNSFGPRAAAKAARAIELAQYVVAVELICAAQGIEVHRPLRSGSGVEAAVQTVRESVAPLTDDRPLSADIHAVARAIASGAFLELNRPAPPKKKPRRR